MNNGSVTRITRGYDAKLGSSEAIRLPDFELEFAVVVDGLEIGAVSGDEACAVGACGEGNDVLIRLVPTGFAVRGGRCAGEK